MMGTDWGDDPQMAELFRLYFLKFLPFIQMGFLVIFVKMAFESKFYDFLFTKLRTDVKSCHNVIPLWDDPQN